jgi:alkylhydroperoxidase family enzyme
MTTLRTPQPTDFSPEDWTILERVAKRMGRSAEELLHPGIFGVQTHWPAWLEANFDHSLATYMRTGALPQNVKEAMHAAVSMTNKCEY